MDKNHSHSWITSVLVSLLAIAITVMSVLFVNARESDMQRVAQLETRVEDLSAAKEMQIQLLMEVRFNLQVLMEKQGISYHKISGE